MNARQRCCKTLLASVAAVCRVNGCVGACACIASKDLTDNSDLLNFDIGQWAQVEPHGTSRVEYMVKVKSQFKHKVQAQSVEVSVPCPPDCRNPITKQSTVRAAPPCCAMRFRAHFAAGIAPPTKHCALRVLWHRGGFRHLSLLVLLDQRQPAAPLRWSSQHKGIALGTVQEQALLLHLSMRVAVVLACPWSVCGWLPLVVLVVWQHAGRCSTFDSIACYLVHGQLCGTVSMLWTPLRARNAHVRCTRRWCVALQSCPPAMALALHPVSVGLCNGRVTREWE
jgi:hypothetical protein